MDTKSKRKPTYAIPRQFSLRTLAISITLICILISIGALKLRQDRVRNDAMTALQHIGFQQMIGSAKGRSATWLRYTKSEFADRDLESSLAYMETIQQRHDLGISDGLRIELVDFTNCLVSEHVIREFQAQLPDTEIRR
jgi:hypothetical protein